MPPLRAVGIDVGAAHTVAAWVNAAGRSEVLSDREGNRLIPSLVLLDDERWYAGEEARLRAARHPERLASLMKLSLGKPHHASPIGGEWFPPEVLLACLLAKLRCDLDDCLDGDYGVVLTAPAFFGELRRKALADAAEIAGLRLLDLLNEPTAAAIAFGEKTGCFAAPGVAAHPVRALVYNLNGFTFECTLLEIGPDGVHTLAVDGDLTLGGFSWDERLADCAAEQTLRQGGFDPREDPRVQHQLRSRVQHAKHSLGTRPAVHFPLTCGSRSVEIHLTREEFVHATADLVDRTLAIAERMLEAAGGWPRVDRVLLTGGATQMPMIRERLTEATGREPDSAVHPQEAVARGAALYARNAVFRSPSFQTTQVATRSLGIQGVSPRTGKKINKILIPRGTRLPATAREKFVIHPGRSKEIEITILEGESPNADECEIVGKAVLHDVPENLAEEWPVIVTYEYTASGRLRVEARLCYTDRAARLELTHPMGITPVQRQRWQTIIAAGASFTAFQAELHRKRNMPVAYAESPHDEPPPEEPLPPSESFWDRARQWFHGRMHPAGSAEEVGAHPSPPEEGRRARRDSPAEP